MSRQRRIPTPTWHRDTGLGGGLSGSRTQLFALIGVVLLVLAGVGAIGAGFLIDWRQDQQRPGSTAISVDGRKYSVRDFSNRAKLYIEQIGGSTNLGIVLPGVSADVIEESLLIEHASEEEIEASEEDIKGEIATLLGITADDPNFDARFQEELTSSGLSQDEYRDMARGNVLHAKLTQKFQDALPETIESIHYRVIQVADQATADSLKEQIEGGADFATLATEQSADTTTKDKGGDGGWVPKGYLPDALESLLFGLEPDEIVTYPGSQSAFVYQVLEKDDAHPIDEEKKPALANQAFNDWLDEKKSAANITNDMDTNTGNVDKIKWVIADANLS